MKRISETYLCTHTRSLMHKYSKFLETFQFPVLSNLMQFNFIRKKKKKKQQRDHKC